MANQLGVRWELANPFGIAINELADVWHSGHVTDVLELDDGTAGLLVATETGGVWTVATNGTTLPLSDSWNHPDVNCLALGTEGSRHLYAGCDAGIADAGVIYETDVNAPVPLLSWRPIKQPLPGGSGNVMRILVLPRHRIIIAACSKGLYWSHIPKPAPREPFPPPLFHWLTNQYVWTRANEENFGQVGYWDATIGATGGLERAGYDDLEYVTIVAGGAFNGIAVGRFDANGLTMVRARAVDPFGGDATTLYFGNMAATSVASCDRRPTRVYAVSANIDGRLRCVWRSDDGGQRWVACIGDPFGPPSALALDSGAQGADWNNCIAVMPNDRAVVAFGWAAGTFLSSDEGDGWTLVQSPHLHLDVHALKFKTSTIDDEHLLYVGSDGGLALVNTADVIARVVPPRTRSDFNRHLATLQCYATMVSRQFYGTMAASPTEPGLVSTGLQDNGNVAAFTGASATAWLQMAAGDGGWNGIVDDGGLLHNILTESVQAHRHQGRIRIGVSPIELPEPLNAFGLNSPVADVVRRPSFHNNRGQRMLAVAGARQLVEPGTPPLPPQIQLPGIYGLFVSGQSPLTYHWERLGGFPADIGASAVGSFTGATIFVGTPDRRIFAFDSRTGIAVETPLVFPKPYPAAMVSDGYVTRIVALPGGSAFALLNAVKFSSPPHAMVETPEMTASFVLRLDGLRWVTTHWMATLGAEKADGFLYGLEVVTTPTQQTVFVSTDSQVYASTDGGNVWHIVSDGLPVRPHNADLRVGPGQAPGELWLYLTTYGRSVWRAPVGHLDHG